MGVADGCKRTCVASESLRQEEVPGRSANVRRRRVAKRLERVEPFGLCEALPRPEEDLDAALGEPPARLGAGECMTGVTLARLKLCRRATAICLRGASAAKLAPQARAG